MKLFYIVLIVFVILITVAFIGWEIIKHMFKPLSKNHKLGTLGYVI